jgi:hypothetical protein
MKQQPIKEGAQGYVTVRTWNFWILVPGTSGVSNLLVPCKQNPELPGWKTRNFQVAPANFTQCALEAFVSLSTHLGYLSTETKSKHNISVFYRLPTEGYTQGGKFG